jgi:predicted enzyme related to lactoylglutathione lyase
MSSSVVHFEAVGKDSSKLRDFYSKVFGWSFNVMPDQQMDYATVDNGGRGINGGVGGAGPDGKASAIFYVAVTDPQATLNQAEKMGGKTAMPVMEIPNVVTLAQFTDPEGNLIGLVKDDPNMTPPPSDARPAANPVTWFEIVGKDGGKLRDFYGKIFGWQFNLPPDMDYGMIDGQNGGIGGGVGGAGDGGAHAIWYAEVADPAAKMKEIVGAGGKEAQPVMSGPMVTFGYFTDPAGNLVGIYKMN